MMVVTKWDTVEDYINYLAEWARFHMCTAVKKFDEGGATLGNLPSVLLSLENAADLVSKLLGCKRMIENVVQCQQCQQSHSQGGDE